MMQSVYKVPQGKLIKIHLDLDNNKEMMNTIRITGDFFAYPEESIMDLELKLGGTQFDKGVIFKVISEFIEDHQVQFIGIDAQALTDAIMRCDE